jgi:hypothetical protein
MKTTDFNKKITSSKLKENLNKQFGANVNLGKYSREQLEDIRNKLRTRVFQQESAAGINDLLTNETYQKDKAMLQLLNTRIKEMLGEDIKKLKDKMVELSEAKKGVRAPKFVKHAKGSEGGNDGNLANNYPPYDKVTRGDVIAGATGKDQKGGKKAEESVEEGLPMTTVNGKKVPKFAADGKGKNDLKKEGWDEMEKDVKKRQHDTTTMKPGETKTSSTGGTITKTKTGLRHSAGKAYGGSEAPATPDSDKKKTKKMKEAAEEKCDECGMWESKCKCPTNEAAPSAGLSKKEKSAVVKKAKKGGDIGKPGKGFKKVAAAAKKGGAKDPEAVAAAAMWKNIKRESLEAFKQNVRMVNEGLVRLLAEDEEGKAKAITAAGDMVNDYTSWMQRVGQYQTKSMIELADAIRADFGAAEAEAFKQAVGPALSSTLDVLTQQREAISQAVAVLAGEAAPTEPMGMEPGADLGAPEEPGLDTAAPDEMNPEPAGDEFAASDAAAGAGTPGREMRESQFARKLAESHSIIAKLAK